MKKILPIILITILAIIIAVFAKAQFKEVKNITGPAPIVPSVQIAQTNLFITADGKVVEGNFTNLPQLFLPQEVQASSGQTIEDQATISAAAIAAHLLKSDFHATNVRILENGVIAVYDSAQTVAIFSSKKSAKLQVDSLQQVLAEARIGDAKVAKIDLRFEKVTITYK